MGTDESSYFGLTRIKMNQLYEKVKYFNSSYAANFFNIFLLTLVVVQMN